MNLVQNQLELPGSDAKNIEPQNLNICISSAVVTGVYTDYDLVI